MCRMRKHTRACRRAPLERQEVQDGDILILQPLLREEELARVRFDTGACAHAAARAVRLLGFRRSDKAAVRS